MDCGGVVTDGMGVALLGGVCGWGRQDQESERGGGVVGGAVSSTATCLLRFPRDGSSGAVGLIAPTAPPHPPPLSRRHHTGTVEGGSRRGAASHSTLLPHLLPPPTPFPPPAPSPIDGVPRVVAAVGWPTPSTPALGARPTGRVGTAADNAATPVSATAGVPVVSGSAVHRAVAALGHAFPPVTPDVSTARGRHGRGRGLPSDGRLPVRGRQRRW